MSRASSLNRLHVGAWALYDFANSSYSAVITAAVFGAYYAGTIVGNTEGLGDWWWGRVGSVSVLVVALSSPLLGSIADLAESARKCSCSIPPSASFLSPCWPPSSRVAQTVRASWKMGS